MGSKASSKWLKFSSDYKTINCVGFPTTVVERQFVKLNSTRTGSDDPLFRSKIRNGQNATNNMTASKELLNFKFGRLTAKAGSRCPNQDTGHSHFVGLYPAKVLTHGSDASLVAKARSDAAVQIRTKIKQTSQTYSGMTILGEFRDTLHQIRHPAEAAFKYTTKYLKDMRRQKRTRTKKDFARALAGSWLEFSFGLGPLIRDISDVAEASLYQSNQDVNIRLRGFGQAESASSSHLTNLGVAGIPVTVGYWQDDIKRAQHIISCGYHVKVVAPTTRLQQVIDHGGFNLNDVIPTAWELLPWSFFIDYFSNIGDILSTTLVSTEGVLWVRQCDRFENETRIHSGHIVDSSGVRIGSFTGAESQARNVDISRYAGAIPFGELRFELPGRSKQFLNIAALAALIAT